MAKIYLVRHGQTLFNLQFRTQGQCDSPLTEKGIEMAKKLGDYFKKNNISFDHGFCSTSERSEDTLNYICHDSVEYTRLKALKEMNFGSLEGGSDKKLWSDYAGITFETYDYHFSKFGTEKVEDCWSRFDKAMKDIANSDFNNVIVVSHGLVIALWLNSLGEEFFKKYTELKKNEFIFMGNCDCIVLEYVTGKFEIVDFIAYENI